LLTNVILYYPLKLYNPSIYVTYGEVEKLPKLVAFNVIFKVSPIFRFSKDVLILKAIFPTYTIEYDKSLT